jgi:hypothetical protein
MPALPAIAIVTAVAAVRRLKDRMLTWVPGTVAILTAISGAGIITEPLLSRVISGLVVSNGISLSFRSSPPDKKSRRSGFYFVSGKTGARRHHALAVLQNQKVLS